MKITPRKDWQEPAILEAQDLEFRNKVKEMLKAPATATELEVPPGYFERNGGERTNLMLTFDIDDAEERKAAADAKAAADKLAADRAAEDDAAKAAVAAAAAPKPAKAKA